MQTTTTNYPRIPECPPVQAGETAEQYGLRCLLFVTSTDVTVTVDQQGLELAHHVFPVAVSARDLSPAAAVRLARVQALITGELRRRAARQEAVEAVQAAVQASTQDRPAAGPMAPLAPPPVPQAPPSVARPIVAPAPAQAPRMPVQAPRPAMPAPKPAPRPAPAAQVPLSEWGF